MFRNQVSKFFDKTLVPNLSDWNAAGVVDRRFWTACGRAGFLCPNVPEEYGGLGLDFRYNAIVDEELAYRMCVAGITLQSDIVAHYLIEYGSEDQKKRWLPGMISGETVTAIAMTEPGTGSDLKSIQTRASRKGSAYLVSGAKTYITNGQTADLILVVCRTSDSPGAKGLSIILVEADRAGFRRGRNLDKVGQDHADTSELFFDNVEVPANNCLGAEGQGFYYLMRQLPQERLGIAIGAQANAQRAFDITVAYTKERSAFGQTVFDLQNTRFSLARLAIDLQVGWTHIDWALERHVGGRLSPAEASGAKYFHAEMLNRVCDAGVQLHGGAGYMNEYDIARMWKDARVYRIYGGTSEIMLELVSRSL